MSHVAKIDLEIHDIEALVVACQDLGLMLSVGQTTYKWFGESVGDFPLPEGFTKDDLGKCVHAIKLNPDESGKHQKAYEIGVCKRKDGKRGFTLLWDSWRGGFGLVEKIGQSAEKLKQRYAIRVAAKSAMQQGHRVVGMQTKHDGSVVIRIAQ